MELTMLAKHAGKIIIQHRAFGIYGTLQMSGGSHSEMPFQRWSDHNRCLMDKRSS